MKQASYLAAVVLAATIPWPIHAQTRAAVALEGAINREQVDGDLTAAIAAYQKIAVDTAAPREVRAKALLHLAGCYEKLGKLAQSVYQQIVREFGDQPAAVQARARLAAVREGQPSAPSSMTQRKLEIPAGLFTPQATDGRRMVYRNDATGELVYSDLATKTSRVIFTGRPSDLPEWMPSRDFSMVALHFRKKPDRLPFIALIQIDGQGYRELIRDDEQGSVFGNSGRMMNWSWDNRYLLVNRYSSKEPTRVLVVSTSTGKRSQLITRESGYFFQQCAFSPDGRFVACKLSPDAGTSDSRIFVSSAQGGEPQLIRQEADPYLKLLDWTADGRYLAVSSSLTGKSALHLLPVKDGRSSGEPILIQSGAYESAFTTKSGTLITQKPKPGGLWAVHITSLDLEGRLGSWHKLERYGENTTNPWPKWSPDSNQLVYTARDLEGEYGNAAVRVRNLATGQDREIYRSPGHIVCVWAERRPQIFCSQWKETTTILSIAPDTGQVDRIGSMPSGIALLYRAGRDDQNLHMWRIDKDKTVTARWEIATGRETVLDEGSTQIAAMALPDERGLVRADRHEIAVKPVTGGNWKALASTTNMQFAVTRDGNWVLYHATDSAANHALFRTPITGGTPERLGSYPSPSFLGSMEISPDGRNIVTASYDYDHGFELWALDNFMPAASKR